MSEMPRPIDSQPSRGGPLAAALDRVGDRWSLLLVEAMLDGPRRFNDLLEAVPGLAYVPIEPEPRLGRLCTSAVQAALGQATWDAMIRDEIDRARAGGAAILATVYHGCQRLICGFEAEGRIGIEHYLSVFARGLGIDFEDRYKKYRLWQDPERVLAETTPCQQANRLDPASARELVLKTFGRATPMPDGSNAPAS